MHLCLILPFGGWRRAGTKHLMPSFFINIHSLLHLQDLLPQPAHAFTLQQRGGEGGWGGGEITGRGREPKSLEARGLQNPNSPFPPRPSRCQPAGRERLFTQLHDASTSPLAITMYGVSDGDLYRHDSRGGWHGRAGCLSATPAKPSLKLASGTNTPRCKSCRVRLGNKSKQESIFEGVESTRHKIGV